MADQFYFLYSNILKICDDFDSISNYLSLLDCKKGSDDNFNN